MKVIAFVLALCVVMVASDDTNVKVGCFPGDALVESKHHGMVRIDELTPGDYIKTYDHSTKQHVFSKFIDYLHYEPERLENYVSLKTDSSVDLEISEYHLIQRVAGSSYEYVFAKDLQLGDQIFVSTETQDEVLKSTITAIETIAKLGAYAPLTEHGTLLANKVLASCFAHVISHELAQWFFLPIRLIDRYIAGEQITTSAAENNKEVSYMNSYLVNLLELMNHQPFSLVFRN